MHAITLPWDRPQSQQLVVQLEDRAVGDQIPTAHVDLGSGARQDRAAIVDAAVVQTVCGESRCSEGTQPHKLEAGMDDR